MNKLTLLFAAGLVALTACETKNNDSEKAESLVAEASTALDRGDFDRASELLDSLQATYPHEVNAGRSALKLRPKIMERKTEQEIVELQVLMAANAAYADSLGQYFTSVARSEEQLEPYLIHKDVPANWRDRNTAIARVSPSGEFYVISSLAGRSTKHTALRLSGDGVSVTSGQVPFDAESLLSRESVRFAAGKADTLGIFAVEMDSRPLTLEFIGGAKAAPVTLSAKEVHALADTYRLSQALSSINPARQRLEQLKAKLQLARDHQARQSADNDPAEQ